MRVLLQHKVLLALVWLLEHQWLKLSQLVQEVVSIARVDEGGLLQVGPGVSRF